MKNRTLILERKYKHPKKPMFYLLRKKLEEL